MDGELRKIKKLYGEDFAKYCRSAFPRILEEEGLLLETLKKAFPPSHNIYKTLVEDDSLPEFKNHIFYRAGFEKYEPKDSDISPSQLMLQAGYSLYRCERESDVMQFVRYYQDAELLCTFDDIQDRLDSCDVFFAVSFDADELDRLEFKEPKREDKYGTSVISIQFDKNDGSLSIKNRYNHTVENPDATFSNDLDNIIPGLTDSFASYYGLYSKVDYSYYDEFYSDSFVKSNKDQYFHFNRRIDDIYFCDENWVVVDGEATYYDKSRFEVFDCFILDKQKKTIFSPSDDYHDSFMDEFTDVKKIDVDAFDGGRKIIVTKNDDSFFELHISKEGTILSYKNEFQTTVGNSFLSASRDIEEISIPKVKTIGRDFLRSSKKLQVLELPEVEEVGHAFLNLNKDLVSLNMPKVKKVGTSFLAKNIALEKINLPEVEEVGDEFLMLDRMLKSVSLPKVKNIGSYFMMSARKIEDIDFPELESVGSSFIKQSWGLRKVNLPKLEQTGEAFLEECSILKTIELPSLLKADRFFMSAARGLDKISMPKVQVLGSDALIEAVVTELSLPELVSVGSRFLSENKTLSSLNMPKLEEVGNRFLEENTGLKEIDLPKLKHAAKGFLETNGMIQRVNLPSLETADNDFMLNNYALEELSLPELKTIGTNFLMYNSSLKSVSIPKLEEAGLFFLSWALEDLSVIDIPATAKGLPRMIKERS